MTITEFLTARYDEDEVAAREWMADYSQAHPTLIGAERAIADAHAKRQVVTSFLEVQQYAWRAPEGQAMADGARVSRETLRQVLIALAQPYTEHPDFDESWKS